MNPAQSAAVPALEQWLFKMDSVVAARQTVLVLPTANGAVFALTRYASMSAYLAGRELCEEIKAIATHMRAARAPSGLDGEAEMRDFERIHGRTRLTDYLAVVDHLDAARADRSGPPMRAAGRGSRAKASRRR